MTNSPNSRTSIFRLIFIPSVITLGVTLLRLVGELQNWPSVLFNRGAGGGFALVGITWLAFVFGVYFALKLAGTEDDQPGAGRIVGFALLGLVILFAGLFLGFGIKAKFPGKIVIGLVLIIAGALTPFLGWKALAKVLLAYGYAARIPVVILMYFAMRGNWGTHYDAISPGFPENVDFWTKYVQLAVIPQMFMWIGFTTVMGSLLGGIALALTRRSKVAAQPA